MVGRSVDKKDEIRAYIKARSKLGCSLKQLMTELSTVYGPSCVSYDTGDRLKKKFESGVEYTKCTKISVVVVEDGVEKYTPFCSGLGSLVGSALHSCFDRFISAIEKRYQASKVKLDEWVIVELEPERKRQKYQKSMSQRLWLDISGIDR